MAKKFRGGVRSMSKSLLASVLIFSLSSAFTLADDRVFPKNCKLYIEELPLDLHVYLKAEIIKKKVPVKVMPSAETADYILKGTAQGSEKRQWHEGWLTAEKDKFTAAVEIVDKEGVLVWASEAGDRSTWWGALKRSGPRKVADRIANNLKKAIRKR